MIAAPLFGVDSGPKPPGLVEESTLLFTVREKVLSSSLYLSGSRSSFVGAHEASNPVPPCPVSLWASFKLLWALASLYKVSAFLSCLWQGLSENGNGKGLAQWAARGRQSIHVSSLFPLRNSLCDNA